MANNPNCADLMLEVEYLNKMLAYPNKTLHLNHPFTKLETENLPSFLTDFDMDYGVTKYGPNIAVKRKIITKLINYTGNTVSERIGQYQRDLDKQIDSSCASQNEPEAEDPENDFIINQFVSGLAANPRSNGGRSAKHRRTKHKRSRTKRSRTKRSRTKHKRSSAKHRRTKHKRSSAKHRRSKHKRRRTKHNRSSAKRRRGKL